MTEKFRAFVQNYWEYYRELVVCNIKILYKILIHGMIYSSCGMGVYQCRQ